MILINVKFTPKPELVKSFPELVKPFTEATRKEAGCLFFDWFRSVENPGEYILVEGFADDAAEAHVKSAHFVQAMDDFPQWLQCTPTIINTLIEGKTHWDEMAEFKVQ